MTNNKPQILKNTKGTKHSHICQAAVAEFKATKHSRHKATQTQNTTKSHKASKDLVNLCQTNIAGMPRPKVNANASGKLKKFDLSTKLMPRFVTSIPLHIAINHRPVFTICVRLRWFFMTPNINAILFFYIVFEFASYLWVLELFNRARFYLSHTLTRYIEFFTNLF